MVFAPDDTAAPLADFGVPVAVAGGPTSSGWLRRAWQVERELGVQVPYGSDVLVVAAGALGALVPDARLTIDGVAFRYRGPVDGPRDRWDRLAVMEATE